MLHHLKVRMYILCEGALQKISLLFDVPDEDGIARLVITGIEPTMPAIEAWRKSIRTGRELELDITVNVRQGDPMEEE